jgi:hypothetical protein
MDASMIAVIGLDAVAATCGAACATVSAVHLSRLGRRLSPGVPELVRRAKESAGAGAPNELALMELADQHAEADHWLSLSTTLPRGLARVSLATGTSLSLVVLIQRATLGTMGAVTGALVAFACGAIGAAACGIFGRSARERARTAREEWRRHFREAARALGAPPEWTRARRAR